MPDLSLPARLTPVKSRHLFTHTAGCPEAGPANGVCAGIDMDELHDVAVCKGNGVAELVIGNSAGVERNTGKTRRA
jgi:hypothetical protein